MTFRMRGIELPVWTSQTGLAVNRTWLEYLRREQRRERTKIEHDIVVAYAMAGSPNAEPEARFKAIEPAKKTYLSHLDGSVHRTENKRKRLEERKVRLLEKQAELDRLDWINSPDFSIADWAAGK